MPKRSIRRCLQRVTLLVLILVLSNLSKTPGALAAADDSSNIPPVQDESANAFLILCTSDGRLVTLDAWTGTFQAAESAGPPLVTRSLRDADGNDATDTTASIVPGLDGRLYWQQSKQDGGSMQPLELTISSLMDHPVRTCDDKDCGILTATAHTQLLALDESGRLLWKSGGSASDENRSESSGRPDQTVVLQRKDFWVQQVSSSGKQVWNVTLGSYQALDFDEFEEEEGDEQWLLPGRGQDKKETLRATVSRSILPSIVFADSGRILLAVDPESLTVLWRIETPTVLVSVFGLYKGRWRKLHVLEEEHVKEENSHDGSEPRLLLAATSHNDQDIAMDWWLQSKWWSPQTTAEQQAFVSPQGLLPSEASVLQKPVCLSGDCPNLNQLPLALPAPPPVAVVAQGLVISWSTVIVFIFAVLVCAFGGRLWYLRKKLSWLRLAAKEQQASSSGAMKHSTSLPEFRGNETRHTRAHSTDLMQTTGSPSTTDMSPTILENGGIPLVRYSRYASEFEELAALGKGGFGTVFRCRNVLDGREYAVKKITIVGETGEKVFLQRLNRVLREVKILAVLDDPNIVRYYTAWLEIDKEKEGRKDTEGGAHGEETMSRCYSSSFLTEDVSQWTVGSPVRNRGALYPTANPLGWRNDFGVSIESSLPSRRNIHRGSSRDDIGLIFERSDEDDSTTQGDRQEALDRGANENAESAPSQSPSVSRSSALEFSTGGTMKSSVEQKGSDAREVSAPTCHTLYIQMQLCSQKTVSDFLSDPEARQGSSQAGSLDIPAALSLFLQVVQAVRYVHSRGLIHRDLKPSNCFMDETGTIKVGDFGLSREASDRGEAAAGVVLVGSNNDQTAGVGTPSYMSTEQMEGSDYDSSTDVFSLGILMFELLYPMYTGMERSICLTKLRQSEFPNNWQVKVGNPFTSLQDLIRNMMKRNPTERPTAEEVAQHIQSLLSEFTVLSLDKHGADTILIRVEADHRENVLHETIQLIHEAAHPEEVEIVQYGMRSAKTGNAAIMEFALQTESLRGSVLVSKLTDRPEIVKARQVSNSTSGR